MRGEPREAVLLDRIEHLRPELRTGLAYQRSARGGIDTRAVVQAQVVDHRAVVRLVLRPWTLRHEIHALQHRGADAVRPRRERRRLVRCPTIANRRELTGVD